MFLFKRAGYYHVEFFDFTEQKIKRISTKTKIKSEAMQFIADLEENLKIVKKLQPVHLVDFIDEYSNHVSISYSQSYLRSVQLSFRMFYSFIGNKKLNEIKSRDFENFLSFTFKRSKSACHLYYRTLKAGFNKAVSWGYINESPSYKIKVPKIPKSLPKIISETDMDYILISTDKDELQKIFIFAANTGMRLNEIINLRWTNVNLKDLQIIVANHETFTTKNKKERIIPLNKVVLNILTELRTVNTNEFVFVNNFGLRYNPDYISKQFKSL